MSTHEAHNTYRKSVSPGLQSDLQAVEVKGLTVEITTLSNRQSHSPTQYVRMTEFLCNTYCFIVTWMILTQRQG